MSGISPSGGKGAGSAAATAKARAAAAKAAAAPQQNPSQLAPGAAGAQQSARAPGGAGQENKGDEEDEASDADEEAANESDEGEQARGTQPSFSLGQEPPPSNQRAANATALAELAAEAAKAEKDARNAEAIVQAVRRRMQAIQASAVAEEARGALYETGAKERAAAQKRMQRLVDAEVAAFIDKTGGQLTPEQIAKFTLNRMRELYAEQLEAALAQQRVESAARMAQLQQQQQQVPHTPFAAASSHIPLTRQPRLLSSPGGVLAGGAAAAFLPPSYQKPPKAVSDEKQLCSRTAAEKGKLEEWIYTMEVRMRGKLTTFDEQLQFAQECWDLGINNLVTSASDAAARRGIPVDSWTRLTEVLRANYTPVSDEDEAWRALTTVAMRSGESMSDYTARAFGLYSRVSRDRFPSAMAAEFLLQGLSAFRFPMTFAEVKRMVQVGQQKGATQLTFEVAQAEMVRMSVLEPARAIQQQRQASESTGGGGGSSSGGGYRTVPSKSRGGYGGNRTRINALGGGGGDRDEERDQQRYPDEGEYEEGYDSEGYYYANAVRERGCFRCGSSEHFIADCTAVETRKCPICKVVGHVRYGCPQNPKNQQPGGGGSAQESRKRGNRGGRGRASGSSAKSSLSSKNE
jgi:hypothetical protein